MASAKQPDAAFAKELRVEVTRVLEHLDLASTNLGQARALMESNLCLEPGKLDEHRDFITGLIQERIQHNAQNRIQEAQEMQEETLPEKVYVRSEEVPALTGTYARVPQQQNNGFPVWKLEGCAGWLFRHPTSKWAITACETTMKDGRHRLYSHMHFNKSPSTRWYFENQSHDEVLTGTVVSSKPNPALSKCHELLWKLIQELPSAVYVNQRDDISTTLGALRQSMGQLAFDTFDKERDLKKKMSEAANGCVAAFFPDLELVVGSERIPANRNLLSSKSPFFAAMLKKDSSMKEAISGEVELPTATPEAVRSLLSLLHSSGSSIDALNLTPEKYLDVLSQAAEWECADSVRSLISKISKQIKDAGADTALKVLLTSSVHASSTQSRNWFKLLDLAAQKYAEACGGELDALVQLPAEALRRLLACDQLDTKDSEGRVLCLVAKWAELHGSSELPELLELVRFPLLRLTSLDKDEKAALKQLNGIAGPQVRRLLGEAALLQASKKRPRDEQVDTDEAQTAPRKRARKRLGGSEIPELCQEDIGMVLCGFLG